jgi:hypothetical protein
VTPAPTLAGVFGITRSTAVPSGSAAAMDAMVTPDAILTTIVPGASTSRTCASTSATWYGLTPSRTIPAPATACRFASGSRSPASARTPGCRAAIASARAAERFVVRMPPSAPSATDSPEAMTPSRIAPFIDPTPRKARAGRPVIGVVDADAVVASVMTSSLQSGGAAGRGGPRWAIG